MANRILRDWTASKKINSLSADEERLFTRLIMKADDYGRFHADPVMIKSLCFPRNEKVTATSIKKLLVGMKELVTFYTSDGEHYLEIKNFGQRLRIKKEKFPNPDNSSKNNDSGHMSASGGHVSADGLPETKRSRNEVEVETEVEVEGETKKSLPNVGKPKPHLFRDSIFFDKEKFRIELEASPPPYCNANCESYYEAALNWSNSGGKLKLDWIATIKNWIRKDVDNGEFKAKFAQPKPIGGTGFKDKQQRVTDHNADQLARLVGGTKKTGTTE